MIPSILRGRAYTGVLTQASLVLSTQRVPALTIGENAVQSSPLGVDTMPLLRVSGD